MAENRVIKLNVGGKRFETLKSTLTKSTYFEGLLDRWSEGDPNAEHFVDYNPEPFAVVLDALRGVEPSVWNEAIEQAFSFFGVNTMDTNIDNVPLSEVPNVQPWTFPKEWTKPRTMLPGGIYDCIADVLSPKVDTDCPNGLHNYYCEFKGEPCKGLDLHLDVWSNEWNRLMSHDEVVEYRVLNDVNLVVRVGIDGSTGDMITSGTLEVTELFAKRPPSGSLFEKERRIRGFKAPLDLARTERGDNLIREGCYDENYNTNVLVCHNKRERWNVKAVYLVRHFASTPLMNPNDMTWINGHYVASVVCNGNRTFEPLPDKVGKRQTFDLSGMYGVATNIFVWFEDEQGHRMRVDTMGFIKDGQHNLRTEYDILDDMHRAGLWSDQFVYSALRSGEAIDFSSADKVKAVVRFHSDEKRQVARMRMVLKFKSSVSFRDPIYKI